MSIYNLFMIKSKGDRDNLWYAGVGGRMLSSGSRGRMLKDRGACHKLLGECLRDRGKGVLSRDAEAEAEAEAEADGSGSLSMEAEAQFQNQVEAEAEAKKVFDA